MELGIIGLGKMGFNMAERLRLAGHKVVGFDFNKDATAKLTTTGSLGVNSLVDLVKNLSAPRAVWIMVPSGDPVDQTIARLEPLMEKGDTFIDGGNSNYKDTQRRHAELTNKGFHFVDCGTSGGVWGLKEGYSLMIGGDKEPVERLTPIFEAFVPDSGEGRWTVTEAIDLNISAPVITESLIRRLRSREENNFTDRMISIMRGAFGGHEVKRVQD